MMPSNVVVAAVVVIVVVGLVVVVVIGDVSAGRTVTAGLMIIRSGHFSCSETGISEKQNALH